MHPSNPRALGPGNPGTKGVEPLSLVVVDASLLVVQLVIV